MESPWNQFTVSHIYFECTEYMNSVYIIYTIHMWWGVPCHYVSHDAVRKLLVSQGTTAGLWPCVPFQRHTGDSRWVENRARATAESKWNGTWQVQGQGKFLMAYIMFILDICMTYTMYMLCISKNFKLDIQKNWMGYTLYMSSISQVIFLYMHDIYHAYTMYIKEF